MSTDKNRKIDLDNDFTEEEEAVFLPPKSKDKEMTKEEKIVSEYKLGMSVTNISKRNNVSMGRIYGILNRNGVELRKGKYRSKSNERIMEMSELEKNSLIDDYISGMPIDDIFKKYDINKNGCYTILDEAGVVRRQSVGKYQPQPKEVQRGNKVKGEEPENVQININISVHTPIKDVNASELLTTITRALQSKGGI